jgi:hypothetical protein
MALDSPADAPISYRNRDIPPGGDKCMKNMIGNIGVLYFNGKNRGGGVGAMAQAFANAPRANKDEPAEVNPGTAPAGAPALELTEQEKAEIAATEPAVEDGNPYDVMFEGVTFSTADSDQVYTNERSGAKSKRIGTFLAHIRGVAVSIPGTMYARLPKGATSAYIDVAFVGTARQSALKPHNEESRLHLIAWKVRTANQFHAWRASQNLGKFTAAAAVMPSIEGVNFGDAQSQA